MNWKTRLKWKILRLYAKIVREKADSAYIARGWAIGMFCGCFFPFGIQLLISLPAAFVLRGSKIGASVGTLLTNHFTVFIIYPAQCYVGNLLIGGSLSWAKVNEGMESVLKEQSFSSLWDLGPQLVAAFFIGGAILAAVMTPITYIFVKKFVENRRLRKAQKKQKNKK